MSPVTAKGERTRAAILDRAMALASESGLEGLTIGSLAEATGMSKSGLFAHFGSREDLQLAVLDWVREKFAENVFRPAVTQPRGLARYRAMFEHWLKWTESPALPGGCPLVSAAIEFDDRPGPVRDRILAQQQEWLGVLRRTLRGAVEAGELPEDADIEQMLFQALGAALAHHQHRHLFGDSRSKHRALAALEQSIEHSLAPRTAR